MEGGGNVRHSFCRKFYETLFCFLVCFCLDQYSTCHGWKTDFCPLCTTVRGDQSKGRRSIQIDGRFSGMIRITYGWFLQNFSFPPFFSISALSWTFISWTKSAEEETFSGYSNWRFNLQSRSNKQEIRLSPKKWWSSCFRIWSGGWLKKSAHLIEE